MQKLFNFLNSRIFYILLAFLIQIAAILGVLYLFKSSFVVYYGLITLIQFVVTLYIINDSIDPSYKLTWMLVITFLPILGIFLYFLLVGGNSKKLFAKRFSRVNAKVKKNLSGYSENNSVMEQAAAANPYFGALCHYMYHSCDFPVYKNISSKFYPTGEAFFDDLLIELNKAEKFIFLEYFIISEGKMWNSILKILKEKAKNGVEVKILYDDFGCVTNLPYAYPNMLKKYGIECRVFNPINLAINLIYNNRDHRKICVIDNKVAFTGGANLADEYINHIERYGYWKDFAISFSGDAVSTYTLSFLAMWELNSSAHKLQYSDYITSSENTTEGYNGYILPFTDTPFDKEPVSHNVYLDIINKAQSYVYITTPYLALDNLISNALYNAAKRGVEVCVMIPAIPDKKIVYQVTMGNSIRLLKNGAKIFKYTPGFLHGKSILSDDKIAVVGSINFDYRSLYLHCENGVILYETDSLLKIKEELRSVMADSEELTNTKINIFVKMYRSVLTIFAPLM